MANLSLQHIDKIYDNNVQAVFDFNLDVKDGEFIVLVGPSGCGKSTTLRMVAGLEDISKGKLLLDGKDITNAPAKDRDMAMVFQNYALYGHMTIYENKAFSLTLRNENPNVIHKKVLAAAEILGLTEQLNKKPNQLSGGQRQRVAMGRSIVRNPKLFLFDEPLSNLDAKLRGATRREIMLLHKRLGATMMYVTHDQTEALTLADRIVCMSMGHVQQIGTPIELYDNPANLFVATFIGLPPMNIFDVKDFGAVGDGIHDDTKAIRAALDFLPEGGRLYFPEGTYLTFPQAIRSHMTIEFAEGAVLKGSPERARYQIVPGEVHDVESGAEIILGAFEGVIREMYQALLSAAYAEDITIIGPGTVDGNAGAGDFWTKFQEFGTARPRLFFFSHCKDIRIHGIHACNSASWQFHPFFSDRVSFYDVFISAPKDSPNTDAIDPESCDYVNIIGCRFSVGDDCIAIKSGKIDLGMRFKKPANHHVVRNCLMDFGHGAVTLGSEMSAGIRNLTVEQCYFRGTDRGLRIKTRRGRGKLCDISGVVFDNIRMEGVKTPVVMNMYYNCCDPDRYTEYVWSREHLPVDDRTPHLDSFHFYNLDCTDAEVAACYIDGLPEMPIDEVCFKDCRISFKEDAQPGVPAMENFAKQRCKLGLYLDNVKKIVIDNVKLDGVDGDEIIANHHEELIVK